VPAHHLDEAVAAKKAWDDFWAAATALAALNREELKQIWQSGAKERTKQ
jgi:hypothetical protein